MCVFACMCVSETEVGDISDDLDDRGGAKHGNGPQWREETDSVFSEQKVYFVFLFYGFMFVCVCVCVLSLTLEFPSFSDFFWVET